MNTIVVIPARLASTRLPKKPLANIAGQPMIVHVLRRAEQACVGPVIVACADKAIADAVIEAGGEAIMTDPKLPSGCLISYLMPALSLVLSIVTTSSYLLPWMTCVV